MHRFRNAVNERRHSRNVVQTPERSVNSVSREDDQDTLYEGNDVPTDTITLNTFVSETATMGDLARQGFVNRCPRFDRTRYLPFVSILLKQGIYCFPSERSYQTFLMNKRRMETVDINTGLGIPLYHTILSNVVKSLFSKKVPVYTIYKYVLIDPEFESIPEKAEFVTEVGVNEKKTLYKYAFCEVFESTYDRYNRLEQKFVFSLYEGKEYKQLTYTIINHRGNKNADTKIDGLNLQWFGTTGFASVFGANNLHLLVLDDNMPSLCDQTTMKEYENYKKTHPGRPKGLLPLWGKYSTDDAFKLPKKRSLKIASFTIGEVSSSNEDAGLELNANDLDGLFHVPWNTEVLSCMAMVLHFYESTKDRRGNQAVGGGILAASLIISTM